MLICSKNSAEALFAGKTKLFSLSSLLSRIRIFTTRHLTPSFSDCREDYEEGKAKTSGLGNMKIVSRRREGAEKRQRDIVSFENFVKLDSSE